MDESGEGVKPKSESKSKKMTRRGFIKALVGGGAAAVGGDLLTGEMSKIEKENQLDDIGIVITSRSQENEQKQEPSAEERHEKYKEFQTARREADYRKDNEWSILSDWLVELKKSWALRKQDLDPIMVNGEMAFTPSFETLKGVREGRKMLADPDTRNEGILTVLRETGIETSGQVEIYEKILVHESEISEKWKEYHLLKAKGWKGELENVESELDALYKLNHELWDKFDEESSKRWMYPDHRYQCNIYSAMAAEMLGGTGTISHWVGNGGVPKRNEGVELSPAGMKNWLQTNGEKYGWRDAGKLAYEQKLKLLETGYFFYLANEGDTRVVFGLKDEYGVTHPVLSRASHNTLAEVGIGEMQLNSDSDNVYDNAIFAHKLMGVEVDTVEEDRLFGYDVEVEKQKLRAEVDCKGHKLSNWGEKLKQILNRAIEIKRGCGEKLGKHVREMLKELAVNTDEMGDVDSVVRNLEIDSQAIVSKKGNKERRGIQCVFGAGLLAEVNNAQEGNRKIVDVTKFNVKNAHELTLDNNGNILTQVDNTWGVERQPVKKIKDLKEGDVLAVAKNDNLPEGHVLVVVERGWRLGVGEWIKVFDTNYANDGKARVETLYDFNFVNKVSGSNTIEERRSVRMVAMRPYKK